MNDGNVSFFLDLNPEFYFLYGFFLLNFFVCWWLSLSLKIRYVLDWSKLVYSSIGKKNNSHNNNNQKMCVFFQFMQTWTRHRCAHACVRVWVWECWYQIFEFKTSNCEGMKIEGEGEWVKGMRKKNQKKFSL